jgi:hypothetical protein
VTAAFELYTNSSFTGGSWYSVRARPSRFMLTMRVRGSSAFTQLRVMPQDAELLMAYPPPRTRNFPATAGRARIANDALPPFRLRSCPQPQRMTAGLLVA